MKCPNCNADINADAKFCGVCGTPVSPGPAQTEPMPTQPIGSQGASPYGQQAPGAYQQPYNAAPPTSPYEQAQPGYTQPMGAQPTSPYGQQAPGAYQQQPYNGAQPTQTGAYADANAPSNAPFVLAIVALACALLTLWPVSIILAIVALVLNSGQKKRGETSTKQGPTTIMSIISIALSTLMLVFVIVFGFVMGGIAMEAIQDGRLELNVNGEKVTLVAWDEDDPSSSSSSAESSSSDAAEPSSSSASSAVVAPPSSSSSSSAPPSSSSSSSASPSSSSSSTPSASKSDIVGTWELVGMTENGVDAISPDDLETLKDMGLNIIFTAKSDGSATLEVYGEAASGTWKASPDGAYTVTIDGEPVQATIIRDTLTMSDDTNELIFERM